MNSTITLAAASSSSTYCSSPRRPLDDIEVHSPLKPTRRIGVARSFSSPSSHLEKDQYNLKKQYHHQQHPRVANKNNTCSLFDLLEVGWEDKTRMKKRASTDFISSNKNKQLAISLTKFQFWTEIEDLTSDFDSNDSSNSNRSKADARASSAVATADDNVTTPPPPPSPATVKEEEVDEEEVSLVAAAVDDLLDMALDCDFQDSFNLESCRMKRRCRGGHHYSFSDMTGEQQDNLLMLDEISISASFSSEDDDDEISIAEDDGDDDDDAVPVQTTVSNGAEHDSDDIDDSEAISNGDDELSLDNTTLQSDKEYDEVHIDEDDVDFSMTDLVMDFALDVDFGSLDSVNLKKCHRAQRRNSRNRQHIKSKSNSL